MWFKNIFIYRLPTDCTLTAATLQEKLALKPLQPCSGLDKQSRGWVSCRGDDRLVHVANQQILFALGVEQKLLPATIINRFVKERIADIEAQQAYKVGRKEKKDIKESVTEELLPRAFAMQRTTFAWIDRELELRATGESKATVRYANHALEGKEILAHIAAGKRATRLGLTWNDRISFVLTEQLQIKRLEFLDIIKEESTTLADNADEMFDLDFTLMTGELASH